MNQTDSISSMHFGGYNALRQTMIDPNFNAITFKTLESSFRNHTDIPPYQPLRFLPALRVLHLSHNSIERFSYENILKGAPLLIEIDLSYNKIKTLDDLIELGSLKELQKLDFSENPVCKDFLRIRIIEFLLFPKKYTSHHPVKILTATYDYVPNESRITEKTQATQPKSGEGEPAVAWELAKCRKNLYDHGRTLIKMNMKECPVPRKTRFSMLKSLNGGIISVQDMRSIVAGDDIEKILVGDSRSVSPAERTKAQETLRKVSETTHKRYLDGKRKRDERNLVRSTSEFIFKNATEKTSDKGVLAAISNLDKVRSQERASQKRQVGTKICTRPLDLEYRDAEFNIGMQEFKEMDKKHEEKKRQTADELILQKKQHLMKLRSMKSKKFCFEEEGALTKEEAEEVKAIYQGIYRGVEPKMDLTQEKHWQFLESSESELDESIEDGFKEKVVVEMEDSEDSEEDGEQEAVDAIDLPDEMLKLFVRDVAAGKYRKSRYLRESGRDEMPLKSRTESLRSENESSIQEIQRKASRFPSTISTRDNDYQSRSPRRVRIDESLQDLPRLIRVDTEAKKLKVEEGFPKKRTFLVKNDSSPNLSLPLHDSDRKSLRGTVRVAPMSRQKEVENVLDDLSPIGKLQNVQVNEEWENSALLLSEEKGRRGLFDHKDDLSLLKSFIKTPGIERVKLINLQNVDQDRSTPAKGEETGKTVATEFITESRASAKGAEYIISHTPDMLSQVVEDKLTKDGMIRVEENLRQIVGPQSRIRAFRTMRGEITSRSQTSVGGLMRNTDMSIGDSKPIGLGFEVEAESSSKSPRLTNVIEIGSSGGDLESSRLRKQRMVKRRVERLREKQREVFKLSNKLFSRQGVDSMRKSSMDFSGTSRFSREKTTRPNSQTNSFYYGMSHNRRPSNEKQNTDGYIALKDLYPQTVSHIQGLNNSSVQFKVTNVSVHTEQVAQQKVEMKSTAEIRKDVSGIENSGDYIKSAAGSESNDNSKNLAAMPDVMRRRKTRSWNKESMRIIIKNQSEVAETNPNSQVKRLLVEDLLPEAKDGMSERQRMKILIHRGEKYESLEETGKLLEQMDILLAEADKLGQRVQIKGGRRNRQVREVLDMRKYLGFADLAQLLREKNKTERLTLKDTQALREFISLANDDGRRMEMLSAERKRDLKKELKQRLVKGDSWAIDSASYQLDKMDKCSELRENLRITKENDKRREIPGYLAKMEREEILRVQNDAIMAAHTVRMQKYCGETYMRKFYKQGMKALEDIKGNLDVKDVSYSKRGKEIQDRVSWTIGNEQKSREDGEKEKYLNEEEKLKIYAENFKQNVRQKKELRERVDKYVREGRKNIDEFLEKERQEIEKLHDKRALFSEVVKLTWENKI